MRRFKKIGALLLSLMMLVLCMPFAELPAAAVSSKRYCVLVLDTSGETTFTGSLGTTIYTADSAIEYVKSAAAKFLTDVIHAGKNTYVAVVSYTDTAKVVSGFSNDPEALIGKVNQLKKGSKNNTCITVGLAKAKELLESEEIGEDDIRNVVLVTTGFSNVGDSSYAGHYDSNVIGSNWHNTGTQIHLYAYANRCYDKADEIKQMDIPIHVLGIFQTMDNMPSEGKDVAAFFRLLAADLASAPENFHTVENIEDIEFVFGEIAETISSKNYFHFAGSFNDKKDSVSTYYYKDDFFAKPENTDPDTDTYNPSLATMSLCLELSTWSSNEYKSWYKPNKLPGDTAFWEDKLHNVKTLLLGSPYVEEGQGYDGIGFSYFLANQFWEDKPNKDSIGVCAARKQIKDAEGKDYTLVACVVRGGGYYSEWASNFTIGTSGEHDGFAKARDDVLRFLQDYLNSMTSAESRDVKLWITGYSRAGATANMVAGALDSNPSRLKNVNVKPENIYCYTFEAPQGATKDTTNGQYGNIHNVLNLNDIVPMVAPYSWGFRRYNKNYDVALPSMYSSADFGSQLSAMMRELDVLVAENEDPDRKDKDKFKYSIAEVTHVSNLRMDLTKILPGGKPLFWLEQSDVSAHQVAQDTMNFLFDTAIPGFTVHDKRAFYVSTLQQAVRDIMDFLMGYDGKLKGSAKLIFENACPFLDNMFSVDTITYIMTPLCSLNPFYSVDSRKNDMRNRLDEKIKEYAGDLFEEPAALAGVYVILRHLSDTVAVDIISSNTDGLNTLLKAVDVFKQSGFQFHYPEVCLAWCRSLDPVFNGAASETDTTSGVTRIIRINCPVDVEVYNSANELVAAIRSDEPDSTLGKLVNYVSDKGEKIVYLPGDGEYRVSMKATDAGTVSYSICEYNFLLGQNTRMQNYYEIPIKTNDSLQMQVPSIALSELKAADEKGSGAKYQLYCNNKPRDPDDTLTGADITSHTVTLNCEGNGGYVLGAGSFVHGSFAKLEAFPLAKAQFSGWYVQDHLLSTDPTYRFAVTEDMEITAKFSDVTFSNLRFRTDGSGTITAPEGVYAAGMEISLEATPEEGYELAGWSTDRSGKFTEASAEKTIFITGEGDTVVTAHFRRSGAAETAVKQLKLIVMIASIAVFVICAVLIFLMFRKKHKARKNAK